MLRSIVAVVVGFVVMAVIIIAADMLAFAFPKFAFDASDSCQVTTNWMVMMLGVGFLAAVLGGWLAATTGREARGNPVLALAALVLILGVGCAVMGQMRPREDPPADTSNL